jgi:hypothetical protein
MILIKFPIEGTLRFPSLIIEWIIAVVSFEIAILFLIRHKRQSKGFRNPQDLGFASLFFGFSVMRFFYIIGDYFLTDDLISPFLIWKNGSIRILFLIIGYVSLLIGTLSFTLLIETRQKYLFFRFFFSIVFLILSLYVVIIFITSFMLINMLTLSLWIVYLIFLIRYLVSLVKKIRKRNYFFSFLKYLTPFLVIPFGFLLTSTQFMFTFNIEIRLLGNILILFSVLIVSYLFIRLPSLSELDWYDKLDQIFIMNKEGACLFHKSFKGADQIMDENLITSAITSVKIMLKELISTEDKGLSVLKKKGRIVSIYSGNNLTGVVYTVEEINTINIYLQELITKLERIYRNILVGWDGDLEIFAPIEEIMNEIFSR